VCGENLKFSGKKLKFAGEKKSIHYTSRKLFVRLQVIDEHSPKWHSKAIPPNDVLA
jgi:hypothetical protein